MNLQTINILDEFNDDDEAKLIEDLSLFSCPINPVIENFIKNKAVDFADGQILGYFALTHKVVLIPNVSLSNTSRKNSNVLHDLTE